MKKSSSKSAGWLFKEEPDHYDFDALEREGATLWDGVSNNLARQHLRKVEVGDRVLFYQTGKQRAIVGEMRVVEGPMADPNSDDPKSVVVKVEPVRRWAHAVSLDRIKKEETFADWDLVRLPRLSVVPVKWEYWQRLEELSTEPA